LIDRGGEKETHTRGEQDDVEWVFVGYEKEKVGDDYKFSKDCSFVIEPERKKDPNF